MPGYYLTSYIRSTVHEQHYCPYHMLIQTK